MYGSVGKYLRTFGLPILSFLLGCTITINLTPIEKSCIIDNTDREYNIMKNSKLKNPELIILILSAPNNLDKRDTIRETWLKLYNKGQEHDSKGFKVKHYFVVGSLGLSADQLLHLSSEQSKHNDILVLPMLDSYKGLTEKVKQSFMWLNDQYDYGLGYKYVLKCDDDSFVNLKILPVTIVAIENTYLKQDIKSLFKSSTSYTDNFLSVNLQVNEKNLWQKNLQIYWGYFSGNGRVKTRGKWRESDWIASDRYIPYALGGGYILSKNLVTYIAKNAENLRSFNSEDVSVGFWLAPVNNILRVHDIRFDTEWTSRGCQNIHLISHNISQQEMRRMYNNYIRYTNLCPKEIVRRNYYIYNWNVPPSQCCKPVDDNVRLQKYIT